MPKKKKRSTRAPARKMNLHDFLGPNARDPDADLPSAPSGRRQPTGPRGRFNNRGENPWLRESQKDRPPSKAEASGNWRQAGGRSGNSWNNRSSRPGLQTSNRFDTQERSSWRTEMGTQDSRFSRSSGNNKWQTQDTRPAHLRNRFRRGPAKQETTPSPEVKKISTQDKAARERNKKFDEQAQAKRTSEAKKSNRTFAPDLQKVALVPKSNSKSPLQIAIEEDTILEAKKLAESFQRLDFKKLEVDAVGLKLANCCVDGCFNLQECVTNMQTHIQDASVRSTAAVALMRSLHAKGNRTYLEVLGQVQLEAINALIRTEQSDEEFIKFLQAENLEYLIPVPDISDQVAAELKRGASADATLKFINSKISANQCPANLVPVVATHVFKAVFDSKTPDIQAVADWSSVLLRCQSDVEAEMKLLFIAQRVWSKAGADSKQLRPLFQQLHESKLVSFDGFDLWRFDRSQRVPNKRTALLAVSAWIDDIRPPPEEEDEDEEEDEEEEVIEPLR